MTKLKYIVVAASDYLELEIKLNAAREEGYYCQCAPVIHPLTGHFYQIMYLLNDFDG